MLSRLSKAWDRKVHRIRFQNCVWKIDESGPLFQPLPEASHDEESGPLFQPLPEASHDEEKVEDVNLDDLWKYIFELWKQIEKGNREKAPSLRDFPWPNVLCLQDLKGIVLLRADHRITDIHEDVKTILMGVNVAIVAPLVVAHTLERLNAIITNREELWHLTKEMYDLANVLKRLGESPKGTQDVMEDATSLIVEGARVFSLQGGRRRSTSEVSAMRQKLNTMYMHINTKFAVRVFTPIQHQRRSHLSKEYPTHAESGTFSQALPGAFHDEAPFSGSFNVSMESKGKDLLPPPLPASSGYYDPVPPPASSGYYDPVPLLASPGYYASSGYYDPVAAYYDPVPSTASSGYYHPVAAYYDHVAAYYDPVPPPASSGYYDPVPSPPLPASSGSYDLVPPPALPASSGYYDLPKRSEGQDVDVNLNISGAPRCDEASSSSSSSGPTKSRSDLISSKPKDKVEDVNLDDLSKHIFELWKLREQGNHEKARSLGPFTWPDVPGLQKLKEIVSFGADLPIEKIYGAVQAILEEIGRENVATAAPLVVACALERLDDPYTHTEEFWHLVKEMYDLTIVLKRLSESPEGTQDVMQEATSLIVEGARVFSLQSGRRRSASEVRAIRQKLNTMSMHINTEFTVRVFTPIQRPRRSHLSKEYPTHADNGQVEEDLLVPELPKAYIHNNEQVEEDLLVPEPQKVYINTGQVEEDLLVPEPQKAYIHNNEEDLLSTGRQKVFKMEALEVATNNFHKDNKVGQGGFGAVYKGTTHKGKQIAVKKMSFTSDERSPEFLKKQFENEKLLAEVQHRNLVNLLGSCEQESQGFLVYEYLPNGSLDKFLFDPQNRKLLDWHKRYNIIQGIARGLQYLHEDSRVRMVHRDIKASNILLDEKLNPKIADFGTANLFPEDRTHVTATSAVGTFGYMAPECLMTGKLSVRTDVYSFGIVLLELLTGEKISSDALKLLGWVWRSYKRKEVVQTIDPTIIETWNKEKGKVLRCIQVALLCIQENSSDRPTMSEVTAMLSTSESLPVPKKPPFQPSTRRSWF